MHPITLLPTLKTRHGLPSAQPGGVPAVQDFGEHADVAAFQDRLDMAHMSLAAPDAAAGSYSVAVYNNDAYLRETAAFVVEALVQPWGGPQQACPFNCSGRGACTGPAACTCAPGYAGEFCDVCSPTSAAPPPIQNAQDTCEDGCA